MDLIGHRGCGDQYPENTVRAMRSTARHLPAVEMDVRRCGSGEVVVFHDETVDRVTDGAGRVADLGREELARLSVQGSGEAVPLLDEVLDALPRRTRVQVELKEHGLTADVLEALESSTHDAVVSSFLPGALSAVHDADPTVPIGLRFNEDPETNLDLALDLGCSAVHPHYDLCRETDVVDDARAEDLRVVAWKAVESSAEVDAVRRTGVDGVTADRWDIGEGLPEPTRESPSVAD